MASTEGLQAICSAALGSPGADGGGAPSLFPVLGHHKPRYPICLESRLILALQNTNDVNYTRALVNTAPKGRYIGPSLKISSSSIFDCGFIFITTNFLIVGFG